MSKSLFLSILLLSLFHSVDLAYADNCRCVDAAWRTDNKNGKPYLRVSNLCSGTKWAVHVYYQGGMNYTEVSHAARRLYFYQQEAKTVTHMKCSLLKH